MAFINGWGRGTWGQLGWGQGSVPVEITGVSATAILTSPGVNAQAVAAVAGITASLGNVSVTINADANATPSGLASTSALGTLASVTGKANITPASQVGTSALGTVTPEADAKVSLTGASATLGNVSVLVDAEATIIITTGLAATSAVGTVTTRSSNKIIVFAPAAIGSVGSVSIDAEATVSITGVSATGVVSTLNVWSPVIDSQTPNWRNIAA